MPYIGTWGKFYHIPRCGGTSMKYYLKNHFHDPGLQVAEIQHLLPQPGDDLSDAWTMVRHPAEWLLSYFAYNELNDFHWAERPREVDEIFRPYDGLFWPFWIRAICADIPGAAGRVFDMFCVPPMKFFHLEESDKIFGEPIGVKHVSEIKPVMTLDEWRLICRAEAETLKKYGYTAEPTGVVLGAPVLEEDQEHEKPNVYLRDNIEKR